MANEDSGEVRTEETRLALHENLLDVDVLSMLIRENHEQFAELIHPMIRRWISGDLGNVTVAENEVCKFINEIMVAREDDQDR